MATRQDLIALVLENLGVLAAGQSASAEDREAVNRRIDPKLRELERREVFAGLNADVLDDAVFLYVGDIIAAACRTPFGITGAKSDQLAKAAGEAEAMLKSMARQFNAGASTAAYDIVQDVLEQLGVVTPGQAPTSQDRGVVSARIAPMLADLRQREIIAFTDLASADAAHRRHLTTILVASCAPAFGATGAALAPLVDAARAAEVALRAVVRQFDTGTGTSGTFSVAQTVLELLGVVEGGQTATAKDVAVVSARYAPLLADLRARHIIDLPSIDGADPSTKHFLATILASRCALLFGAEEPVLAGLRAEEARAESALRAISRQLDTGIGTGSALDAPQSVLEILGVVSAGQSASPKDRAVVATRLPAIFADLRDRQIITVTDFAAASPSVQPHLITIIAAAVAPLFSVEPALLQTLGAEAVRAEAALRIISRQVDSGVATAGAFDLIQVTLENLGAVAVGRTATDKDRSIVSGRVTAVLDDLRQREVISIPSLAGAAPSTLLQLSVILTSACAMAFGIPAEVRGQLRADAERAEIALRAQARQLDSGSATSGTFDLPQVVLEALGVIDAGQTASAKDRAVVSARIAPVLADLQAREIISIPSLDAAPDAVKVALSVVVTAACAPAFQVEPAARAVFEAAAAKAEVDLRAMARQFDTSTGTAGTYDLVQSVLEMLGVVSGGQTASAKDRAVVAARAPVLLADLRDRDIIALASTDAAAPSTKLHLAVLLAARCATLFGADAAMTQSLKAEAALAETALRRIARQIDTGTATSGNFDPIQSVLETLGVVSAGQTATMRDRAVVSARVAPMLADLAQREIIAVPSLAAADAATQIHLSAILALTCAVPFGVPAEPFQAPAAAAEVSLRLIGRQFDGGVATSGTFDVIQAVLENLGVVSAGYTGSAKDRAVVSARVGPTLADLRLREIASIASLDAADPGVLIHLSAILTSVCAQAFGKDATLRALLAGEATKAETALRALARQLDTGSATSGTYDVVQATLEMLGVIEPGQTGSDRDRAVVFARVQPKLMELYGRDICGVTDLSQLTPELQGAFARCLAADCLLSFPAVPASRAAMLLGMVPAAEQVLRWQSFVYDARPPLRVEPFWGRRHCRPDPGAC
ncbi:hypothetical protein [Methylobacterium aquaticum]|uniref:Uncharacterized protein n=1 Tax=Methylobacterium aquaticum TaxID=270351 RepID=A0A0C6EVA0_9HYPH|nr:hypothetical protein [Methylobacterium aquaticum]BAQ43971.1 hypothetical protein Maq22A_c02470 [Methylobacterium aquaticum]